jgi:hypothetical protein
VWLTRDSAAQDVLTIPGRADAGGYDLGVRRDGNNRVTRAALREYYPDGRFARRIQAVPELGCVYVKNAKAATSTLMLWLHRAVTGDHDHDPHNIHLDNALPTVAEVGWPKVIEMLNGGAYSFSFVRDPVRRVESAYLDKVVPRDQPDRWRAAVRGALGLPETPEAPVTFDQFVAALETMEPLEMNVHWRPQHLNLMHPVIRYDHIGRLETFDHDIAVIRRAIDLPDLPIRKRNEREGASGSLFDGRVDLLRVVHEVYAKDLELYGY